MENEAVFCLPPVSFLHRADTRKYLRVAFSKTTKILCADQKRCRTVHECYVGYLPKLTGTEYEKWVFLKVKMIFVRSFRRVEPGVRIICHRKNTTYSNIWRKQCI